MERAHNAGKAKNGGEGGVGREGERRKGDAGFMSCARNLWS
jgi:hypothetical protein